MPRFTRTTARVARAQQQDKETKRELKPRGPAKVAVEFRLVVKQLLERNAKHIDRWFREVADGCSKKGLPPDPAKALDLMTKLAEFAAPKLQRTEVVGDHGNGPPITQIAITFVDGRAPSAPQLPPVIEASGQVVLDAIPAKKEPAKGVRKRVIRPDSTTVE